MFEHFFAMTKQRNVKVNEVLKEVDDLTEEFIQYFGFIKTKFNLKEKLSIIAEFLEHVKQTDEGKWSLQSLFVFYFFIYFKII